MKKDAKKFMVRGIVFAAIFAILILVPNYLYLRFSGNSWVCFQIDRHAEEYIAKKEPINYLFLGDSHTYDSIRADRINGSFNYGNGGEAHVESYFRFKNLVDSGVKIDTVVLEIDIHSFFYASKNIFNNERCFEKYLTINEMGKITGKKPVSMYMESYLPIFGIGDLFLRNFELKKMDNFSEENKVLLAKQKVDALLSGRKLNMVELEYFLKMVYLAKNNSINLVLINYPLSKEYLEELPKNNITLSDFNKYVFSEVNKITQDYDVLDYSDVFIDKPELFANPDHLNQAGAQAFSDILATDIADILKVPKR